MCINKTAIEVRLLFIIAVIIMFLSMNLGVVKYNSAMTIGCIAFSSLLMFSIWLFKKEWLQKELSASCFYMAMISVFVISFISQSIIVYCVPLEFINDFLITKNQVEYMAETFAINPSYNDYYHAFPFNLDTVGIITAIYKLVGNYTHVVIIFASLVNIAGIIIGLSIKNITNKSCVAIFVTILYELYSLFAIKTYWPYTGNLGLLFVALIIYAYTLNVNKSKKILLVVLFAAIGWRVKMTCLVPFVGISIIEGINAISQKDVKHIAVAIVSFVVCFGGAFLCHKAYFNALRFESDPTIEHNVIYYFALGQNTEYGGQHYHPISVQGDIHRPKEVRDSLFMNMALDYIKERGVFGNVKFFVGKIAYCWGDTNLDYHTSIDKKVPMAIRHSIWYVALMCMTIGIFIIRDRRYLSLMLSIFGAILYLYISEASASYVIMYSPIVFVMMGWMLSTRKKKHE